MFHRIASIDKVGAAVGWVPTHDLDGILADVIDHTRREPRREPATVETA